MIDLSLFTPAEYPTHEVQSDDPRLASLLQAPTVSTLAEANVVLFGVPTNEGVRRNGGRVGAAEAPAAIRQQLVKLTPFAGPQFNGQISDLRIVDLGDIRASSLEEQHQIASETCKELTWQDKTVIALGGGHDITYPLASGFRQGLSGRSFGLINVDAHLDVREKKLGLHHSGSSFRLLIEEGILEGRRFCELGIQSFAASAAHFDWVIQQGARILTFEDATTAHLPNAFEECEFAITLGDTDVPVYLSFDVDCIRASDAPGVSAPAPIGFLAEEAYELAVAAGLSKHVRVLDIVEMNPTYDIDSHTARLVARMIAAFLAGVANRDYR